jgi:hypothetical protein
VHKHVLVQTHVPFHTKWKFEDVTSRAFRNNGKPFILLDWNRLNYNIQAGRIKTITSLLAVRFGKHVFTLAGMVSIVIG